MPNVAIHPSQVSTIEELRAVVDGFPEEIHRIRAETGDEPLETGAEVTDHAVAKPEQLELTGRVSDLTAQGASRPRACWDAIRELNRNATPVRAVTPWGVYEDMIILEVEAERQGRSMRFTMKLVQIIRVGLTDEEVGDEANGPAEDRTSEEKHGKVNSEEITGDVEIEGELPWLDAPRPDPSQIPQFLRDQFPDDFLQSVPRQYADVPPPEQLARLLEQQSPVRAIRDVLESRTPHSIPAAIDRYAPGASRTLTRQLLDALPDGTLSAMPDRSIRQLVLSRIPPDIRSNIPQDVISGILNA